ncbi:hypothetical protein PSAB6_100276 [Paraburkholderia sabiae]|nr:hypothetical protein PSAB6_100276 [Paraburkholderia sabiae]
MRDDARGHIKQAAWCGIHNDMYRPCGEGISREGGCCGGKYQVCRADRAYQAHIHGLSPEVIGRSDACCFEQTWRALWVDRTVSLRSI